MVTSLKYYPRIKLEILLELILFEIPLARTDMTACNQTGSKIFQIAIHQMQESEIIACKSCSRNA